MTEVWEICQHAADSSSPDPSVSFSAQTIVSEVSGRTNTHHTHPWAHGHPRLRRPSPSDQAPLRVGRHLLDRDLLDRDLVEHLDLEVPRLVSAPMASSPAPSQCPPAFALRCLCVSSSSSLSSSTSTPDPTVVSFNGAAVQSSLRDPRCEDPPSPSSVSNVAVVVNVVVLVFVIVLVIIQFRDLYLPSFADSYFRHVHTKP